VFFYNSTLAGESHRVSHDAVEGKDSMLYCIKPTPDQDCAGAYLGRPLRKGGARSDDEGIPLHRRGARSGGEGCARRSQK